MDAGCSDSLKMNVPELPELPRSTPLSSLSIQDGKIERLKEIRTLQQNVRRQTVRISKLKTKIASFRETLRLQAGLIDAICDMLGDDMKEKFKGRQGMGILGGGIVENHSDGVPSDECDEKGTTSDENAANVEASGSDGALRETCLKNYCFEDLDEEEDFSFSMSHAGSTEDFEEATHDKCETDEDEVMDMPLAIAGPSTSYGIIGNRRATKEARANVAFSVSHAGSSEDMKGASNDTDKVEDQILAMAFAIAGPSPSYGIIGNRMATKDGRANVNVSHHSSEDLKGGSNDKDEMMEDQVMAMPLDIAGPSTSYGIIGNRMTSKEPRANKMDALTAAVGRLLQDSVHMIGDALPQLDGSQMSGNNDGQGEINNGEFLVPYERVLSNWNIGSDDVTYNEPLVVTIPKGPSATNQMGSGQVTTSTHCPSNIGSDKALTTGDLLLIPYQVNRDQPTALVTSIPASAESDYLSYVVPAHSVSAPQPSTISTSPNEVSSNSTITGEVQEEIPTNPEFVQEEIPTNPELVQEEIATDPELDFLTPPFLSLADFWW